MALRSEDQQSANKCKGLRKVKMTDVNFSHPDDDVLAQAEQIIIDAEFTILSESNQQVAVTETGLHYLIKNWTEKRS